MKEIITEGKLLHAVVGQMYAQAPKHRPRKVDIIVDKLQEAIRATFEAYDAGFRFTWVERDEIESFIRKLLFAIPEFEELNLSENEFKAGVTVNDPDRSKYSFTCRYDIDTEESLDNDFIDLDAFTRNVTRNLLLQIDSEKDCAGCELHNKEYADSSESTGFTSAFQSKYIDRIICFRCSRYKHEDMYKKANKDTNAATEEA